MKLIHYLQKNGLRHALSVVWEYHLDRLLRRMMRLVTGRSKLINAIVIESHNDFDSNGGAFYDYLIQNGYHHRYRIIWLLKHKMPKNLPENVKCYSLHGPSLGKAYYLCRAKYLCFDNEMFSKLRADQVSVFCDHGAVALKSVRGIYQLPQDVNYVLSPSANYAPTLAREYGVPVEKFRHIGYPYHDVLYRDIPSELGKLTDKRYRKVFLWMPTFRKGGGYGRNDSTEEQPFGVPLLKREEEFTALQDFLSRNNSLLIIKIHPMQDPATLTRLQGAGNIAVLTGEAVKRLGIDNYRLLKSADGLISDYSSIAFSYLLLDRPLAFVLSDRRSYKLGFAMDDPERFLVGHRIETFSDFYGFLESVLSGSDPWQPKRKALMDWLYEKQDGNSCQRLAALLGLEK